MLSQFLCGTVRPVSSHIVHEVQIRDQHGELQRIRALIDCGATSICISPQRLNRLGLPHEAAHITTQALDGQVITHAEESRKTVITVQ
jgi:predicted aspartyl protease